MQNQSIIDLVFSSFSLGLVNGGIALHVTWGFMFFSLLMVISIFKAKKMFKKNKE